MCSRGGPDRGQPTRFLPRRNRHVFRVEVPKDFGTKELVWTLTSRGRTEQAYTTLKPDYKLDSRIYQTNMHMLLGVRDYPQFEQDLVNNIPPVVTLEGAAQRTVGVGVPLALNALVADDGRYQAKPAPPGYDSDTTALGLRVAWFGAPEATAGSPSSKDSSPSTRTSGRKGTRRGRRSRRRRRSLPMGGIL